jgi:hypothetical protein
MTDLIKILNNPEEHYPGNFDTPQRANALLTGLCQDAANEIAKLQYEVDAIPAIKEERDALAAEVLEQCRIIAMSAAREDALRAELTQLKASIALDKMAENARELGLDYEPAPVQECLVCNGMGFIDGVGAKCRRCDGRGVTLATTPPAAQPAVQTWPVSQDPATQLQVAQIIAMRDSAPPAAQPAVQEPVYLVEDDFGLFRITTKGDWNFYNVTVPGVKKTLIANATLPAAQPAVPEGWKLVPARLTQSMAMAAKVVDGRLSVWKYDEAYQAMLAAAPEKGQP